MNEAKVLPAYTFRPMTRMAMVIERLTAESGHPAASIFSHIGVCPHRTGLLRLCRSLMFDTWENFDPETGDWDVNDRSLSEQNWAEFSGWLLADFGQHTACPNCAVPCHPVLIARAENEWREIG